MVGRMGKKSAAIAACAALLLTGCGGDAYDRDAVAGILEDVGVASPTDGSIDATVDLIRDLCTGDDRTVRALATALDEQSVMTRRAMRLSVREFCPNRETMLTVTAPAKRSAPIMYERDEQLCDMLRASQRINSRLVSEGYGSSYSSEYDDLLNAARC